MVRISSIVGFITVVLLSVGCGALKKDSTQSTANVGGDGLFPSQYFSPPDSLRDVYGEYRSTLQFDDGSWVSTSDEWPRRRAEIETAWHSLMGEWPPLLDEQALVYGDSVVMDGYIRHHVRFKWMPNEWTDGYLLVPENARHTAAVITVFYEPESAAGIDAKPDRDYALQLVNEGFVTLSIGTRAASKAREYSLYYPSISNATVEPLSMLAYAAANAWHVLAKVPEVDSTRIGIIGHSFGGKWAMFASCLFDKFACGVWSDPGIVFDETKGSSVNYWEPWYLGYYPKPWENEWRKVGMVEGAKGLYPKLIREGRDLHELHALMAPRPFLVSGGSSDPIERWKPLNHSIRVNTLLEYENRVAMTNRPEHSPNKESNALAVAFLKDVLQK